GMSGGSVLRLPAVGAQLRKLAVVRAGPTLPPRAHRGGIDLRRLCRRNQQRERLGDIAFEIAVGVETLVDHVLLEGVVVDRDDLAARRPPPWRGAPRARAPPRDGRGER